MFPLIPESPYQRAKRQAAIAHASNNEHPLQYAIVNGLQYPHPPLVYGTENMNDLEILQYLRDHSSGLSPIAVWKLTHSELKGGSELNGVVIERFNRCHICEEWSPCRVRERDVRRP